MSLIFFFWGYQTKCVNKFSDHPLKQWPIVKKEGKQKSFFVIIQGLSLGEKMVITRPKSKKHME